MPDRATELTCKSNHTNLAKDIHLIFHHLQFISQQIKVPIPSKKKTPTFSYFTLPLQNPSNNIPASRKNRKYATLNRTTMTPSLYQKQFNKKPSFHFTHTNILILFSLIIILGFLFPYMGIISKSLFSTTQIKNNNKWRNYTLKEAVEFVGQNGNNTVIVCIVSEPYLGFLNNWLISITRHKHQDKVLVIAEDYETLFKVNDKWPGHAVIIPPVLESSSAHKFGSLGFFNFTARRPRHLLNILELGYNVLYNDVDMVWLKDPFPYLEGNHDIYFMDDVAAVKPMNHSHALPPPGKKGRPYVCSCLIFLRPTSGAKLAMRKWIEELQEQPWTRAKKANDQPAFNWALMKIEKQVDMYLLPQSAFPTGGLYFKNKTWVRETKGSHVIIHNNYILGFEKKIKRFRDYDLWLVDKYASESPLGKL